MKRCSHCKAEKPLEEFHRARSQPDGRHKQCAACRSSLDHDARVAKEGSRAENEMLAAMGLRRCTGCCDVKALDLFYRRDDSKVRPRCIECSKRAATPESRSAKNDARRRRREADPEAFRRQQRATAFRRKYGIELEQYEAMLESQSHCCAICGDMATPDQQLFVDHDHETGVVRGLLCLRCNTGIGMLGDDPDRLATAIRYLRASLVGPETWNAVFERPT